MSQNHIPAPWTHHPGSGDIYKDGYLIASVRLNSHNIEPEERATAQRIVQCVNALEEIENPTQLVEDYKSMKALLKEMLMIWDRGDSVSANCVYPNAVRFALGVEQKRVQPKEKKPELSLQSLKLLSDAVSNTIDLALELEETIPGNLDAIPNTSIPVQIDIAITRQGRKKLEFHQGEKIVASLLHQVQKLLLTNAGGLNEIREFCKQPLGHKNKLRLHLIDHICAECYNTTCSKCKDVCNGQQFVCNPSQNH
jgi:hypothetical protein